MMWEPVTIRFGVVVLICLCCYGLGLCDGRRKR